MKNFLYTLSIIFFLFPIYSALSIEEVIIYNSETKLGDELCIELEINNLKKETNKLTFLFFMDNPTLFYPEEMVSFNASSYSYSIDRLDIQTYKVEIDFSISLDKVELGLCGISLAGNDSMTVFRFQEIFLNDDKFDDLETSFKIQNNLGNMPYIRFLDVSNAYPNPVFQSNKVNWKIYSDIEDKLKMIICGSSGKIIDESYRALIKGENEISFDIDLNALSVGVYYVIFKSETGELRREFSIIK